jgi:N-acetylmuramoyl-L-alanine amidase
MVRRPVTLAGLLLVAVAANTGGGVEARLPDGANAVLVRGADPVLLVLPKRGEGWLELAARLTGGRKRAAALRAANPSLRHPLRDVRVRVPWDLLRGDLRVEALQALFPADHRLRDGWVHRVVAPWGGEPESWLEMATWWTGDASNYKQLRRANPSLGLFPSKGSLVLVPEALLSPEFRRFAPEESGSTPTSPAAETSAVAAATVPSVNTPEAAPGDGASPLEYTDHEAVYRLRPGEALYSAVVVRFTGQLHAADVNSTAAELARLSGIHDVTDIPVGYPVRIPFDLLLPEYLPPGHPRRREWEKEREELAAIRRVIRAANLEGIQVVLDAGHGGTDTGAIAAGVWESTYVYDVMTRLKDVLERDTRAIVWTLVRDRSLNPHPPDIDVLPQRRTQELLTDPPYDLGDSSTGVHLRWILTNSILQRLRRQKVDPERVVLVSIHADSLHPAVRGLMVYTPARTLRPSRTSVPRGLYRCREVRELSAPRFSSRFRARSEALSTQLGESIVSKAKQFHIPVHAFEPVRSSVLRGRRRWVPAVLRYSEVPTSVLIEICNLNNPKDRELLLSWRFREKLAHAIAAGLAEGFSR